jgi:16S rRNA (cytosine967-C5)-methyltransferase
VNSRLVAARVLSRILLDGVSLTVALESVFSKAAFSEKNSDAHNSNAKDKAFVQALCFGVCRQYHRLEFILNALLDKPIKDQEVKILLLIGLYQLGYMRVKPYAAVSESVLAIRKKPWAKGVINAVLRNYLRQKDQLEANADNLKTAALSHPDWLIQKIEQDWPECTNDCLVANNLQPPMALRVNLAKIGRDEYRQSLQNHSIESETIDFCQSAIILKQPVAVDLLPGFKEGLVSVQDTAAQLAADLLGAQEGQRVLDVCAAPGGKTLHILEKQIILSELVALDIDSVRMQRVKDNLLRSGLACTTLIGDAASPESWWDGRKFDRILLDAPCSATGVIRRHPDIKLLRKAEDIEALKLLQKKLLHAVWPLMVSGGILVYATCSVLKEENERQMLAFLAEFKDAFEIPIEATWGRPRAVGRQILTGDHAMDGFYYARLQKK